MVLFVILFVYFPSRQLIHVTLVQLILTVHGVSSVYRTIVTVPADQLHMRTGMDMYMTIMHVDKV